MLEAQNTVIFFSNIRYNLVQEQFNRWLKHGGILLTDINIEKNLIQAMLYAKVDDTRIFVVSD